MNKFTYVHTDPLSTEIDIDSIVAQFKNNVIDYNADGGYNASTRQYEPVYKTLDLKLEDFIDVSTAE